MKRSMRIKRITLPLPSFNIKLVPGQVNLASLGRFSSTRHPPSALHHRAVSPTPDERQGTKAFAACLPLLRGNSRCRGRSNHLSDRVCQDSRPVLNYQGPIGMSRAPLRRLPRLTRQSRGVIAIFSETLRMQGVRGIYAGSAALIAGNGMKAGVRFMSYDSIKEVLRDPNVGNHLMSK